MAVEFSYNSPISQSKYEEKTGVYITGIKLAFLVDAVTWLASASIWGLLLAYRSAPGQSSTLRWTEGSPYEKAASVARPMRRAK